MADSPEQTAPLHPPIEEYEYDRRRPWDRITSFFRSKFTALHEEEESLPPSGYLTLIPLSDARLQPRDNRLTALSVLLFGLFIACLVFILVPRDVRIGEISVVTESLSWNTTTSSYQLRLLASLPVYNPNYLQATVDGDLKVQFYSAVAGESELGLVKLGPRALPQVVDVPVDASQVPEKYILSVLGQCTTFPRVLIFFLKGNVKARFMFQTHELLIDTYFMINCEDGSILNTSLSLPSFRV